MHRFQVGDHVVLDESPWVGESKGRIIQVMEQSKPKATSYTILLDDGQTVRGVSDKHLKSPRTASAETDAFRWDIGTELFTPLGPGKVVQQAHTPLGNVYRVETAYDNSTRDFLEHELKHLRIPTTAGIT